MTDTDQHNSVIPLPAMRRLWRVKFADSLDNPKVSSVVLVRGAASVFDAATQAKKLDGWKGFQQQFPNAEIVGCEFGGRLEN